MNDALKLHKELLTINAEIKNVHDAVLALKAENKALKEALAQQSNEQVDKQTVTVLPDGSAFAIASYPLPETHWLYAKREYADGEDEPIELGKPILTHEVRDAVISAVRYAVRGATMCGKESDFDPDALVQNAVYALCGPYTPVAHPPVPTAQPKEPEQEPVAWLHWLHGPVRLFLNKDEAMMELDRLNREYPVDKDARQMKPLYTTPPQRKPLTRGQIREIEVDVSLNPSFDYITPAEQLCRAIEAAHGIKE